MKTNTKRGRDSLSLLNTGALMMRVISKQEMGEVKSNKTKTKKLKHKSNQNKITNSIGVKITFTTKFTISTTWPGS